MKIIITILLILSAVSAQTLTATWEPVILNEDSSECTDLAGYRLYRGIESGIYQDTFEVGNITTFNFIPVRGSHNYIALTAVDYAGNESGFSEEVSIFVQAAKRIHYPTLELSGYKSNDADTAIVDKSMHVRIAIKPYYEDSTAFNTSNVDSIQVDIRSSSQVRVYSETLIPGEHLPSANLEPGLYYINASAFDEGIQGAWRPMDKWNWFRLDKYVELIFESDLILR